MLEVVLGAFFSLARLSLLFSVSVSLLTIRASSIALLSSSDAIMKVILKAIISTILDESLPVTLTSLATLLTDLLLNVALSRDP